MKKKVVIAGGTGLIGSRLIQLLPRDTYEIFVLSRKKRDSSEGVEYLVWDPVKGQIDCEELMDAYAVINLAGTGIANKRWSRTYKRKIMQSRIAAAKCISKHIASRTDKLPVYIGASAVGYYGDHGEEILDEKSEAGTDFLASVCKQWEKAHKACDAFTKRSSVLRIGVVLSTKGGALKEIADKSLAGVYSYFGDGSCYYPWIHIDDLCRIIIRNIEDEACSGVYNACAKNAVKNKDLVQSIARIASKFSLSIPVPEFILKLILGEMSLTILSSIRAIPKRLDEQGFEFKFSDPDSAVKDLFDRKI